MDVPSNLDAFLTELLHDYGEKALDRRLDLDPDDRAFIEHIMQSVTTGSKGVLIVLHPNDRLQYMLLNTNKVGAVTLLGEVMGRTADALNADMQ